MIHLAIRDLRHRLELASFIYHLVKLGAFLDLQAVQRYVRRFQENALPHRIFPHFHGLPRYREHQIQVYIVEARLPGSLKSVKRIVLVMYPAEHVQHVIVKRLDAYAQPVDALSEITLHLFIGKCRRIRFYGYFRIMRHIEIVFQAVHDPAHVPLRKKRRRAASYIYAVHLAISPAVGPDPDLADQSLCVFRKDFTAAAAERQKITVSAFSRTKRYMKIYPQFICCRHISTPQ